VKRIAVIGGIALVALLVAVAVGRWERARHADRQNDGIARVLSAVGELDSPSLDGFRFLVKFQCLTYGRGSNDYALELCVDRQGRVVEAIDRRSGEPEWWSLREDPGAANVRVDRPEVERLIVRMCPDCKGILERDAQRADS
jgi:hypothetical protein